MAIGANLIARWLDISIEPQCFSIRLQAQVKLKHFQENVARGIFTKIEQNFSQLAVGQFSAGRSYRTTKLPKILAEPGK